MWLAALIGEDTEVRIAQGIYTPDRRLGIRSASFDIDHSGSVSSGSTLGFGIILKGAFAGIKALDPNERDTNKFKSVLSGDLNGDEVECPLHGSAFNVITGEALTPPANESAQVFEIQVDGNDILVGPAKT